MVPTGPCFEIGRNGYFAFTPSYTPTQTTTTLGATSGYLKSLTAYDRDGRKWRVQDVVTPFPLSRWRSLLAHTIYNPQIAVTLRWWEPTSYALEEVKAAYVEAIDQDDDILTQFVEASELKGKVAEAQTFDQLVAVYQWMQTEQPDDQTE